MDKRKLKQFFKENCGWITVVLWFLLASTMFAFSTGCFPVQLNFTIFCILFTVIGVPLIVLTLISVDISDKKWMEKYDKRLQELKTQNKYYIDLVDRHVKETLNKFKDEFLVDVDTSFEYIICFSNKVNWICNNRIVGKPDSFIIASCLMYSLISHPVVTVNKSDNSEHLKFNINMDIAMNCVFEIISEPSTYFEDNGIWIEEKHPKVNISVPNGLIKNSELYQRILNSIYWDQLSGNRTSIMQFSNLLHLIYLNCQ